ncbi:Transcriptional regulator LytR [Arthrobacter sp. SO5]|uniref:LCP family protein n=1 Tax=Arthrobacter sp. SO5 TaxID=1897055 RepID=UPI001E644CAF|nr:LCP family protein [Arthrobacter sp. SO5]MCB5272627.1 Transcriptional regulator LytR [Arthrobacter sp. SO5]
MSNRFEVDREPAAEHGTAKAPAQLDTGVTPRRKARTRRALMVCLLVMILLVPGSVGAYFFSLANIYDSQTTKIEDAFPAEARRVQAPPTPAGKPAPMNILVLGSDSRDKAEGSASAKAAAGSASNQRADTLMLLHIPSDREHIYSVSLMRDLWVDIPDRGQAKINAALAFGGVPLMVQTVESLLQQRIDHVVSLDFAGFKGLTDALGGVEVDIKVPFTTVRGGKTYDFRPGLNTLNGAQGLAFVRERYAFPDGDYQRVRNQQTYLRAVLAKTFDGGTLGNPITLAKVLSAVSPYLSVAPKLDSTEVGRLAFSLRDIRSRDTVFFTLPTAGVGRSADGQSIVLPDTGAIEELKAAFTADKLADFVAAKNLGKGN